jgi:putative DNA primase/helicase
MSLPRSTLADKPSNHVILPPEHLEEPGVTRNGRPGPKEDHEDPHRLARIYLNRHGRHEGDLTIRFWRDEFHKWDGTHYQPFPMGELRAAVTNAIKIEFDRISQSPEDSAAIKGVRPKCKKVTCTLVGNVVQALAGMTVLPGHMYQPAWLEDEGPFPADQVLAAANGLIHLPSLLDRDTEIIPPMPRFFSPVALDYHLDLDAPLPTEWLKFLKKLWPDDDESIATLQEWFGYMLTLDTRQQKILMLVGPKRSGKGTIARVLRGLVGQANVAGPTLSGLGTQFGLWPLLGKSVAIISDARLSGRSDAATVMERLLSISGEDAQTIDRKNLSPVTTKLTTRFTILTNELPRLGDASGALASRMLLLRLTESWYGREDPNLSDRLLGERSQILRCAIDGWLRLEERGHFVQPTEGQELLNELEDLHSPVGQFVRERCLVEANQRIPVEQLYSHWKSWCELNGRKEPGTLAGFGRDLWAAVPTLRKVRTRDGDARPQAYQGIGLAPLGTPIF